MRKIIIENVDLMSVVEEKKLKQALTKLNVAFVVDFGEIAEKPKKIKLKDKGYVYELIPVAMYLSEDKSSLFITRTPTDNEADGFEEYDELCLEVSKEEFETLVVEHTFSTKVLLKALEQIKGL